MRSFQEDLAGTEMAVIGHRPVQISLKALHVIPPCQ